VIIDPAAAGRSGRTGPDKSTAPDVAGGPTSADPERLDLAQTLEHLFTALTNSEREVAKALFGLADIGGVPAALLPTGSDVARSLGKTRQRIQQVQTSIRRKWANSPITDSLQDDLAIRLDRNQGLLVVDEVSRSLAVEREPGRIDAPRDSMARALVGIAADLEAQKGDPRYRLRRRENRQFVVASDELLRYALDLGRRADQLVAQDPLPDPPSVRDTLVETTRPAAVAAIPPDRLARLAAAGSSKAAVSARGELYPVGLSIERTVRLAGATLGRLGTSDSTSPNERRIARSDILDQLRRRYPEADLPEDGKSVAGALAANGWQGITYDGTRDDLVTRLPDAVSLASPESRITLSTRSGDRGERPRPAHADEISSAREFEESLRDAFTQKRFQALVVAPHHHRNAVAAIAACYRDLGVEVVDLDELITTAIDDVIEKQLPNPEVFYTAEAIGPEGRHWRNVLDLAHRAIDGVIETLRAGDTPVLLVHAGLVGRFDRPDLFETFNQTLTGRESPRGVVLLIVGDDAADAPLLDGWAIPCLGEQFHAVPKGFLRAAAPSAAG